MGRRGSGAALARALPAAVGCAGVAPDTGLIPPFSASFRGATGGFGLECASTGAPTGEADGRQKSELLPQGGRLPVGLSGPHQRAGVHPADRPGEVHRRVSAEPRQQRVPGDPRTHLRSPLRAGLPARRASTRSRSRSAGSSASRPTCATTSAACCPRFPAKKNGKRVACIGAGPASLAVANDLAPLGYEVVIFERYAEPGGLMRTNVPTFRLPRAGAGRGDRHDPRRGRRHPLQHAGRRA